MIFNELKKNLKKDFSSFKKLKLALLGDSSTQLLSQAIRGTGYGMKLDINIYEADFNKVDQEILDLSSELYSFQPDVTLIFESGHKLLQKFNKTKSDSRIDFANTQFNRINQLIDVLQKNIETKVFCFNYPEIDDRVFGNFANKVQASFIFQQRKLNFLLSEFSLKNAGLNICDISTIQNTLGRNKLFSPSIYINTEFVISIDALPLVAESIVQMIAVLQGRILKCIILDLDNTIWGGVIGDEGIENIQIGQLGIGKAFTEFQYWLKKLEQRGIILCVCSKNFESVAKEPFEKHPDMVLRLKDIGVFIANWENKVDNIKLIQKILNIGFDSMVFIDDNPFERNMVSQSIPAITIPELPTDPAEYLEYLYGLNLFETASYSLEDGYRTELYQKEAVRIVAQSSFNDENDFLKSLNMISEVKAFDSFSIPRVAQLSQRSNQFNLRTIRYDEADLKLISDQKRFKTFSFNLEDKFGDNGLICAVILVEKESDELFIDTWFMSCRVLKRGMENFVLNIIVDSAYKNGYNTIIGEYLATEKNGLVKDHYKNLGFHLEHGYWLLKTTMYRVRECFIKIKGKQDYAKN